MIDGSLFAPFRHDSSWPDEVLSHFRAAIYYYHEPVPGLDCFNHLRELAKYQVKHIRKDKSDWRDNWILLQRLGNKVIHLQVEGVDREERRSLAKNLLIIANILLIEEHALRRRMAIRVRRKDEAKNPEIDTSSKARIEDYLKEADRVYKSLEEAVEHTSRKAQGGQRHSELRLGGARALAPIAAPLNFIEANEADVIQIQLTPRGKDDEGVCAYAFRPHDPIGWEMTSGNPHKDRFANDGFSSPGIWGT